jgi:outer membrane protein insertion porin family
VTEVPSAEASAALSYGTDGFGLNLSVNQSNFMGTGKTLGIAFDNNRYSRTYQFNYNNPYYTVDGISRGFTLYSVRVTPGRLNLANFSTDSYGGSINYGIPISAKGDTLQVGLALQKLNLSVGSTPSVELLNFVNDYGSCAACNTRFNQALFTLGWNRNGFDRAIFPTRGLNQMASLTIAAPVGGRPLDYYKTSYDAHWYHPLTEQFILSTRAAAGYGNSYGPTQGLPFFQNYYAGGMGYAGAVRGYDTNSLGPLDSQNNPLGGNFMVTGSVGLVFPNFINPDRVRTTLFVDAGNVYNTRLAAEPPYIPRQHAGYIRCSTGLAVEWRIPSMGVLNFSLAKPLNPLSGTAVRSGDSLRYFDFSVGTSF